MSKQKRTISGWVKDLFFANLTAKIMALIMALGLWSYAYVNSLDDTEWEVPVVIEPGKGWAVSDAQSKVRLVISYPKRQEDEIDRVYDAGGISVLLHANPDEDGPDEQILSIPLTATDILVVEGESLAPKTLKFSVKKFKPVDVDVKLVREITKNLAVKPLVSDPPAKYQLAADLRAFPASVEVRGPKDALSNATFIETEEVPISSLRPMKGIPFDKDYSASIAQYVTLDGTRYPVKCNADVMVRIVLTPIPKKAVFKDLPIQMLVAPDYPYEARLIESKFADVTIIGPKAVVESITKENIRIYVDVSVTENLKPDDLPWPQSVRVQIVGVPHFRELTSVKPSLEKCDVMITLPDVK